MVFVRSSSLLLCTLFIVLGTALSQALQLGESEAQITARHGAPAVEDHGRRLAVYFWTGWSAQAEFKDGVVNRLTYRRNTYLTEGEIQSLLQANGGVARWQETSVRGDKARLWSREDGANAQCVADRPTGMVFHGSRELTPSEAILNESFLKFSAPESATMVVPVQTAGQATTSDPVILSNATPEPSPRQPALTIATAEEVTSAATTEAVAAPKPAAPAPLSEVPGGPTPPPLAAPTVPPAEGRGLFALIAFTSLALGAIVCVTKVARTKKSTAAPRKPNSTPDSTTPPLAVTSTPAAVGFDTLRWDQLELFVGEIFRRQGYAVELSAALGADGGTDLMLRRDGENIPVQCKHWKTSKVGDRELREFYAAMADTASPRGVIVTTGSFTREAREFAAGKAIELLDGAALDQQIAAIRRPEENIFDVLSWIDDFTAGARIFDPECPFCRGAMTVRQNRSTGAAFWGCTAYPRCAGKRDPRTDLLTTSAV